MSATTRFARTLVPVALASALTLSLALPTGCAGTTGGKRFEFDALAGGVQRTNAESFTFSNQRGWSITLAKARITVGPVYLNVNAPLSNGTAENGKFGFLNHLVTHAHAAGADFLGGGRVVGEVLGRVTFDALSATLVAFPVRGSIAQEPVRTADICFFPSKDTSPESPQTNEPTVEVEGVATRDNQVVIFRGALVLNDSWVPTAAAGARDAIPIATIRQSRGISAPLLPTEGGRLELRFDVRALFRGADFSNVAFNPRAADGAVLLAQGKSGKATTDQVMTNMFQGLKASRGTFFVAWRE
jgi:hypothetical protein